MKGLKIGKNLSEWSAYSCQPTTNDELEQIIKDRISKEGHNCDLNDIDTSLITDMSYMFEQSKFNKDISNWKINKDCDVNDMFEDCQIKEEYKPVLPI